MKKKLLPKNQNHTLLVMQDTALLKEGVLHTRLLRIYRDLHGAASARIPTSNQEIWFRMEHILHVRAILHKPSPLALSSSINIEVSLQSLALFGEFPGAKTAFDREDSTPFLTLNAKSAGAVSRTIKAIPEFRSYLQHLLSEVAEPGPLHQHLLARLAAS